MTPRIWLSGLALLFILTGCAGTEPRPEQPEQSKGEPRVVVPGSQEPAEGLARIEVGGEELEVELAATFESHGRGLAGRRSLPARGGMLFIYQESSARRFWMKDCLIGLDIAFLDENRRILSVHSLPAPEPGTSDLDMPRATTDMPARFVLETNRGFFAEHDIGPGEVVQVPERVIALAALGAER